MSALQSHASPERGRLNLAEHLLQIGDVSASREILYPSGDRVNADNFAIAHASTRDGLDEKLRLNAVALMKVHENPPAEGHTTRELDTHMATSMASKSVVFAPWESKNWAGLAFIRTQSSQNAVT